MRLQGRDLAPGRRLEAALPQPFADVRIMWAQVPSRLDAAVAGGVLWQAAPGRFLLHVPEVAGFLAEGGCRLTIDPVPGSDAAEVARFARMTPLAALAWQRGVLAFHAAAAAGPNGAVLLAGTSGAGKSTLLAALLERGWTMIADDLAIVSFDGSGDAFVHAAEPELLLWPDAFRALAPQRATASKGAGDRAGRLVVSAAACFASEPQRLQAFYSLSMHSLETVDLAGLAGSEGFAALNALSYNTRVAAACQDRARFLAGASLLTRAVRIRSLNRPRGRWSIDELSALVEEQESRV